MKLLSTIAVVALTIVPAAWAGSMSEPQSEPAMTPIAAPASAPYDWSGLYGGISAGSTSGVLTYLDGGSPYEFGSLDGQSMGLFAGYNFQRNNLVYGAELALQNVDAEYEFVATERMSQAHDLKLRIGYAQDNILFYAFGGLSKGKFEIESLDAGSYSTSGSNMGLGVELAFAGNWLASLEYIRRSLDGSLSPDLLFTTFENDINTLQLRLGYKF